MNNFEELKKAALAAKAGNSFAASQSFKMTFTPDCILNLIAQLEVKERRTIACVNAFEGIEIERFAGKSIGEFLAGEVRLNKAEPKPDGSFGFTFSGLAIQIMAESFADQFKSSGAVNYLELLFEHSEIGPLTVTMQRVDGLTPAQKLAAAEERAEVAEARLLVPDGIVPDGMKLVPVEPTENMVIDGFESEPDESFSDAAVWEEYEAMSGCEQAAHRAKLCWAAMLAAAPQPAGFTVEGE